MTRRAAAGSLVLVSLIWGASFVATKEALRYTSPLVFLGARFAVAVLPLLGDLRGQQRGELRAGLVLGLLFWAGFVFQTVGLERTTPSRSAFVTALSSPLVPVVAFAVYRELPRPPTALAIAVAVTGTYLLLRPEGGGPANRGDLLTLGCAALFAGQIVAAGRFARRVPVRRLLAVELAATAVLSLVAAPLLEAPRLEPTATAAALIVALGATGGLTFYLQLRAQAVVDPSVAALIFTLEPVFAALASYLVLGERLGPVQWVGGALILAATALPALEVRRPPGGHRAA